MIEIYGIDVWFDAPNYIFFKDFGQVKEGYIVMKVLEHNEML